MTQLAFAIGPVQSLIALSRRTRELHAGSHILSWLAGVALLSLHAGTGGRLGLARPVIALDALDTLVFDASIHVPSTPGWPNRFVATLPSDVDAAALAIQASRDVQEAWCCLAESIWQNDLQPVFDRHTAPPGCSPQDVRSIWCRQIAGTFEVAWALVANGDASPVLAARKHLQWRHRLPEPGLKCSVTGHLQDLSGARTGNQQRQFWDLVAKTVGDGELAEEALCAVAFVKRRLRELTPGPLTDYRTGRPLAVAERPLAVPVVRRDSPSTSHIAVASWRRQWRTSDNESQREELDKELRRITGDQNATALRCDPRALLALPRTMPVAQGLSPFFAVLRMDVDSLGMQSKVPVLKAVSAFAADARAAVERHEGYTVYAGGDDLLALLPVDGASRAAAEIRQAFEARMRDLAGQPIYGLIRDDLPTISASLVFAHVESPLARTLWASAEALDDHAKGQAGRDAIAVELHKPGGLSARWVAPWEVALTTSDAQGTRHLHLQRLAKRLHGPGAGAGFSSAYLYGLRALFDDVGAAGLDDVALIEQMMLARYLHASRDGKPAIEQAQQLVHELCLLCRQHVRVARPGTGRQAIVYSIEAASGAPMTIDAALIARFLSAPGAERA